VLSPDPISVSSALHDGCDDPEILPSRKPLNCLKSADGRHCAAGVGRSPAAALVVLADRYGPGREADALEDLLVLRPEAVPNLALTAAADAELGRGGALLSVVVAKNSTRDDWQSVRARKQELFDCFPDTFA
jgi:hypothetical protein